ncbi:MAG: hypothetical protein JNL21_17095 [Myxococcales bacterium]|nr:hypothetical protein [Myxococcales bacterium]
MRRAACLLLLSTFVLGAGCKGAPKKDDDVKDEKNEKSDKADKKGAGSAGAAASADAPKAVAPNPNDAFFTIQENKDSGVYRIRAGAVTKLEAGGCSYIEDLAVDHDGRAWLRCLGKVFRSEGDKLVEHGQLSSVMQLAIGRDGSVWAGTSSPAAVHRLVKDAWVEVKAPDGLDLTWDLVVDDKGKPWISTKGAVWVREGETWQPAPLGNDKPEDSYPSKVVPTDDGTVWVLTDKMAFIGIENGKPGTRTFPNFQEPVARPGGGVLVENNTGYAATITVYDGKGKQEKTITPTSDKVFFQSSGDSSKRLTADKKGRVWIGTGYGLIVVEADGTTMQQLEPGRVPGLTGANVQRVAVAGDGPELPKLGDKVRGGVKGKVNVDKPTQVELCAGFIGGFDGKFYGPTPCSGQAVLRSMKTDKDGNFELKDVPPYNMSLLIQTDATSWVRRDPKCCTDLKTGQVKDIGSFDP